MHQCTTPLKVVHAGKLNCKLFFFFIFVSNLKSPRASSPCITGHMVKAKLFDYVSLLDTSKRIQVCTRQSLVFVQQCVGDIFCIKYFHVNSFMVCFFSITSLIGLSTDFSDGKLEVQKKV